MNGGEQTSVGWEKSLQIILTFPHPHPSRNYCQKESKGSREKKTLEIGENLVSCSSTPRGLEKYQRMYLTHGETGEWSSLKV